MYPCVAPACQALKENTCGGSSGREARAHELLCCQGLYIDDWYNESLVARS